MTQKSAALVYLAVEAWSHAWTYVFRPKEVIFKFLSWRNEVQFIYVQYWTSLHNERT